MEKLFYAYSSYPKQIGNTIEEAVSIFNRTEDILSWTAMDVIGNFIPEEIFEQIKDRLFIADISYLNCNVIYEIGYAIGQGKPIILTKNVSLTEESPTIFEVGIFDTIGYLEYQNGVELATKLKGLKGNVLFNKDIALNFRTPVFIQETLYRTDFSSRIAARVKKARLYYRSFDPNETPRLSAYEAIREVAQSYGVIVQYLSDKIKDSKVHNVRASFIAGLAKAVGAITIILQSDDSTSVPIDYRDFITTIYKNDDINGVIAEFASNVVEAMQDLDTSVKDENGTFLEELDLGASAAENEMRSLNSYYLKVDAYLKASRGEVQLIVGKKGSGKSAIFLQIRDKERSKGKNIVLDLKPEGYKLIKFKEQILDFLQEGTFQHTIMAFWEYLLLLEISHRILETDRNLYKNNTDFYEVYTKLQRTYKREEYLSEGDFSERMSGLMESISQSYKNKYGDAANVRLSVPEITGLIYSTDIKTIKEHLEAYLKKKDKVWLLFDNIDKGWPASGLKHEDLIIIRALIDASRKIQRHFEKKGIDLFPIIFLRNDVYDLLVDESPDKQKEAKELLDWTDSDLLRQLIKLRVLASNKDRFANADFEGIWRTICISHYKGEESFQYLVDRCLMRPRFLINLINQCKSIAINLGHQKILEADIEKGFGAFSSDLLTDISYEIRDILPEAENVLFGFITSKAEIILKNLYDIIESAIGNPTLNERVLELLIWYGFLGIKIDHERVKYIYDFNYSMLSMKSLIKKNDSILFMINPGFWPSLLIDAES